MRGVTVERSHPDRAEARSLLDALSDELIRLTGADGRAGFDGWRDDPGHVFLIARRNGQAVGCGALRPIHDGLGEVKRLYAVERGQGVGRAVLAALEAVAKGQGMTALRARTRRTNAAACAFYRAAGYGEIANWGDHAGDDRSASFEKRL